MEKLILVVRGMVENFMTKGEVELKCLDLLQDILGKDRANSLIGTVRALEEVQSMRELRSLLSA